MQVEKQYAKQNKETSFGILSKNKIDLKAQKLKGKTKKRKD